MTEVAKSTAESMTEEITDNDLEKTAATIFRTNNALKTEKKLIRTEFRLYLHKKLISSSFERLDRNVDSFQ